MKKIENFGAFIIDGWPYALGILLMVSLLLVGFTSGRSVSLNEKDWVCTIAVPDGITTRCTAYSVRGK